LATLVGFGFSNFFGGSSFLPLFGPKTLLAPGGRIIPVPSC